MLRRSCLIGTICRRYLIKHRIIRLYCGSIDTDQKRALRLDVPAVLQRLKDRFLINDSFPDAALKDLKQLQSVAPVIYAGFDPTAESLHVGHLLIINCLLHLHSAGFQTLVLIGEATALLGDPSFRANEREPIDRQTVRKNAEAITAQLDRLFSNFHQYIRPTMSDAERSSAVQPVRFVNNIGWYANLNAIDFATVIGRHFRLRHMLGKESVKMRRDNKEGMSFAEFSYQLFQAYDWLRLYEETGCLLQLGGSDQIGNMHSGHDLISHIHNKQSYGLAAPLLCGREGEKMGKTGGTNSTVWLNEEKLSSFEFYQYFLRLPDVDVPKYLHLLTFLPLAEIDRITQSQLRNPSSRIGQRKLADQLTLLVHGKEQLASAQRCSEALYNGDVEKLNELTQREFDMLFAQVPVLELAYRHGMTAFELAMLLPNLKLKHQAEQAIRSGGFSINYEKIRETDCVIVRGTHILPNNSSVIRTGKKQYYLVRWR